MRPLPIDMPAPPTRNEELNPGPSYIDRLQDLDTIIQHTPINERAESKDCQMARALLNYMRRPKFHVCRVCGDQYGNQQTEFEIKSDADVPGICARCEHEGVNQ